MATITDRGDLWDTSNNTAHSLPSFTANADDLIVVVHGMSGWASGDTSLITDNQGGAYTQIGANPLSTGGGTNGALWISIRTTLIGAVAVIITETPTGSTGSGLTAYTVAGMTRTGADAALQNNGESTQTENPPVIAFGNATLTANPIVLAVFGEDNPPALTAPTGFTETFDSGWATPTSGIEVCFVNSGQTASSYSWTGGNLADHNEVGVELDTSAAPTGWGPLLGLRNNRLVASVN